MTKHRNTAKQPGSGNRSDVRRWDMHRFERWVRVGVESFVLEDLGPAAFPEAAHHILTTGSLSNGLQQFAEGLDAKPLDDLKHAIGAVLSSLEPRERYVRVAEQLLAIAVAVSAYPVLGVLAQKIGGGFFGQPDPEGRDSLFAMTLYTAARLAAPGRRDAEHCLHELIESDNFQPAHASTALLALCQVDPRGLPSHLSAVGLRRKLTEQFASHDSDGSLRRSVAENVLAIIGLRNFKDALYELAALDPNVWNSGPDDWLTETLIFAETGSLEIEMRGIDVRLRFRDRPEDFVLLDRRTASEKAGRSRTAEPPYGEEDLAEMSVDALSRELTMGMAHLFPTANHSTSVCELS